MKKINIDVLSMIVAGLLCACNLSDIQNFCTTQDEKRIERKVERALSKMSTRQKVAQLMVSQTDSYIFSEGHALLTDTLVGIEGIGGLLIIQDSLPRYLNRMNELQRMSKIPLLVSIDGEWGPSMRF